MCQERAFWLSTRGLDGTEGEEEQETWDFAREPPDSATRDPLPEVLLLDTI